MNLRAFAMVAVLASLSLSAQAMPIVGTFTLSGDSIVTAPNFASPTNIMINNADALGITTGGSVLGNFASLIPVSTFFAGAPGTVGSAPFGSVNQSGGFYKGSVGGMSIASGTTILNIDDGSGGAGLTGVRLSVTLISDLTFNVFDAGGIGFIFAGATAIFSTNVGGWDPTPGRIAFSSQQSGGSLDNAWSASFSTSAVPVPPPLALVGLGLGLIGAARRWLNRA